MLGNNEMLQLEMGLSDRSLKELGELAGEDTDAGQCRNLVLDEAN